MASLSNINGLFDVHSTGAILFSDTHGANGQILKSNGNAAPTWVDPNTVGTGPWLPLAGGAITGNLTIGGTLGVSGAISQATASSVLGSFKGTSAPGYAEFNILNDVSHSIVIGSIGSTYSNGDWAGSTYVYNTGSKKMYIKSQNEMRFTTNGTSIANNTALVIDTSYNSTFTGTIAASNFSGSSSGTNTGDQTSVSGGSGYLDTNRGTPSNAGQYWQANNLGTTEAPSTDWYNTWRGSHGSPLSYYSNTLAIKMTGTGPGTIYVQTISNGTALGWNKYWHDGNLPAGSGVTSLVAGTGIGLTNASGPAVTVTATTQFNGPTFTSRNSGNPIAVDSATSNMSGYCNTSSAAGYSDGGLFVAAYSSSWVSQIFSNFRTGEIAVRGKNNGTWQAWRTVWDSVNLPNPVQSSGVTSITTSNGVTGGTISTTGNLSLDGTFSGRWNPTGIQIVDSRSGDVAPNAENDYSMKMRFTNQIPGNANWQSLIQMKGWTDGYTSWQLIGPSTTTAYENWYLRSGLAGSWGTPRQIWHTGNAPSGSGVTSVATGTGLTGGTITTTGTLSVDSSVVRVGILNTAGNTSFAASSTATGYSVASIELRESNYSGASGTPPFIGFHWGGVVASNISIESSGRIAILNNPGTSYENFIAKDIYASNSFQGNLTGNASTATLATTATTAYGANAVVITGYGSSNFSFYQGSGSFAGFSGWHNYYIGNHGNGSNYYNTTIAFPFWGSPRYSRLESNVLNGPHNFLTSEECYNKDGTAALPSYSFIGDTNTGMYRAGVDQLCLTTQGIKKLTIRSGYTKLTNNGDTYWDGYSFHVIHQSVTNGPTVMIYNSAASGNNYGINVLHTSTSANTTGRFFFGGTNNGATEKIKIYTTGTVQNATNSYGSLSDIKLKENITDATPKLDNIMKVKIKNFNYIGDDLKQIGVIAQELEEVFPGLVYDTPDSTLTDKEEVFTGTSTKGVKYSIFVPMLVKAMQEQQVIIEDLKSRLEILEKK